jgi:hypothetical protein
MTSRKPGPTDFNPLHSLLSCKPPVPVGTNDYANPLFWLKDAACRLLGDTPGPLGVNDHADPRLVRLAGSPVSPELLKQLKEKESAQSSQPAGKAASPLEVSQGQVTFDAEGNDNSKSPYYSRVSQWPENALSGVTLGRGYDMGGRSEAKGASDLVAAGLPLDKANAFAKGAGKKGPDAEKFVKENKEKLGEFSQEVQISCESERDLIVIAFSDWLLSFDNISAIPRLDVRPPVPAVDRRRARDPWPLHQRPTAGVRCPTTGHREWDRGVRAPG